MLKRIFNIKRISLTFSEDSKVCYRYENFSDFLVIVDSLEDILGRFMIRLW